MRQIAWVAVVVVAGCTTLPPSVPKVDTRQAFTAIDIKHDLRLFRLHEIRDSRESTLELAFTFHGPIAASTTYYGELQLLEAADDTG